MAHIHWHEIGRPDRLRANGFAVFIEALRANIRAAGALRIDHVMMRLRLFWIPAGGTAQDGAYVRYAWQELFAILALESRRHRCLVVGRALAESGVEVGHILGSGEIVSHAQEEDRLLQLEHLADDDLLMRSRAERLAEAYRARARKAAYAMPR